MYLASDLSSAAVVPTLPANVTDKYEPCTINPDHGYTVVYNVTLPAGATNNDTLSIEMCSPGGYDQVRRTYPVDYPVALLSSISFLSPYCNCEEQFSKEVYCRPSPANTMALSPACLRKKAAVARVPCVLKLMLVEPVVDRGVTRPAFVGAGALRVQGWAGDRAQRRADAQGVEPDHPRRGGLALPARPGGSHRRPLWRLPRQPRPQVRRPSCM